MTAALAWAAYLVPGLYVGRRFAGWVLYYDNHAEPPRPDSPDKWMAFGGFVMATCLWPLFIIGAIWNAKSEAILPPPPHIKERLARAEKERLREQVADYERRLGIDPPRDEHW